MSGNALTFVPLLLRVFLPFAFAYFLSYIFRGVNAVIFPYLERDIGITAADLGLLTAAFFLFFAGCQPILGVLLDRYGPRRVQTGLLILAAAGSALFGLSSSLAELVVARMLIGLGFAGGLMAAIKAFTLWYPPHRWGVITGYHMTAGGAGSMAATLPVQWSLSVMDWQGLFFWLAGICLLSAALLFFVVPKEDGGGSKGTLREQFRVTRIVLTDGFYWRIQPLLSVQQLAFISCISLWVGPWLRDVGGISNTGLRLERHRRQPVPPRGHQPFRLVGHHEPAVHAGLRLARLRAAHQPARSLAAVRLPGRTADPVHAADGVVVPARLRRPRQHQQQPAGLLHHLRRPVGDREDRRSMAADGDRLLARRLHLGFRRAVHSAAGLPGMAGAFSWPADG